MDDQEAPLGGELPDSSQPGAVLPGGDHHGPELFAAEELQSQPQEAGNRALIRGAEDIYEAFRLGRQSAHESSGISQSAHEGKGISQSVPEVRPTEAIMEARAAQDVLVVLDPPTRRVTGKSTPGHLLPPSIDGPSLRPLRKGGEWNPDEELDVDKFELWQHQRVKKMIQEEMADMMEGKPTDGWAEQWIKEVKEMEKVRQVQEAQARVKTLAAPEVLQTRTVPLEEVKKDLEKWRPAFEKEYRNLTEGPVEVLDRQQVQKIKDSGVEIEMLPMKAVTVQKPDKLKARFVVCGNMAEEPGPGEEVDTSVGGACTMAVRCLVHKAALEGWSLGTIDVAAAFLQAPRRGDRVALVEPPSILRLLGISKPGEYWLVKCALYGYMQSPADWAHFRDSTLATLRWEHQGGVCQAKRTAEPHVWEVVREEKEAKEVRTIGFMTVYVDDILVASEPAALNGIFKALKTLWKCSEEEIVQEGKETRFCGYELKADGEGGYYLSQEHYLKDVLKKRG